MATGAAPMRPKGGLIRDLLEGSFPELYPAPTPTPEPEEKEEAAEAEAEETTDESPDEKETASLSEADASEKEPEVDDAVPETGSYRPPTPDLDAYAKRIAEIDAEVNTRTSFPDREDTRRWSTTQNGCPLSFFPRFSQSTHTKHIRGRSSTDPPLSTFHCNTIKRRTPVSRAWMRYQRTWSQRRPRRRRRNDARWTWRTRCTQCATGTRARLSPFSTLIWTRAW